MSIANRVIKNTGILYARMAVTVVLSLYTTRVVLDALGVEDFGIFNLVGGVIAMLVFLNASMATATQRFMSFAQGQGDEGRQLNIFNVSIVLHVGIAMLLVGILEVAGLVLFSGVLKIAPERTHTAWLVYQFAIASTFFTVISVPYDAVINARENMLLFAVLGVIESILKLGIALALVNATTDKLALYGFLMASVAVGLLAMRAAYCMCRYPECELSPRHHFSRPIFKEMTVFAGWSLLGSATSMIANYGQVPVMNAFFGTAVNAAQGISNQICGQLSVLSGTMLRALNPIIVKSEGAGDRDLMLSASLMGGKISFFLLMLIYVPVIVEMPYLLHLWLKSVPDDVVMFCILQMTRNLVEQFFITLSLSIAAVGNIRNYQIVISSLTIFPLIIAIVSFNMGFDPAAMYYSFLLYTVGILAVTVYYGKKLCQLQVYVYLRDTILRCSIAFLIVLCAGSFPLVIMQSGFARLVLVGLISLISFIGAVWWVGLTLVERTTIGGAIIGLITKFQKK